MTAGPPSLWPQAPEPSFPSGTFLHRLGQNSAAEYWMHRSKNFCRVEKHDTTLWVMRSQATSKEHPAQAVMQEATARTLVEMLQKAGIYATKDDDSGKERLHLTMLESHFTVHCIVMGRRPGRRGIFPSCVLPRHNCANVSAHAARFVQRSECPHVYFVAALERGLDLDLPAARQEQAGATKGPGSAAQEVRWRLSSDAAKSVPSFLVSSLQRQGAAKCILGCFAEASTVPQQFPQREMIFGCFAEASTVPQQVPQQEGLVESPPTVQIRKHIGAKAEQRQKIKLRLVLKAAAKCI